MLHAADLVVGRFPLVARLAHDVEPHRGVTDVARVVEQRAALLDRVEVLREGLEVSQGTPSNSVSGAMSSTCWSVRTSSSRCSGRTGAIENPQLPATTLVTPCQHDGVSAGSQNTWAS